MIIEKDPHYSKATPRAKEDAVQRKSRKIGRARALSLKELPNLKIAYDPYYRPYLREARQRLHAYYTEFMAPNLALPKFTREDFPSTKPPPEKIGGHLYSQQSYEKLLGFITTITIPLPTATDEKIKEAGFGSWKEYVIHAVLENWKGKGKIEESSTLTSDQPRKKKWRTISLLVFFDMSMPREDLRARAEEYAKLAITVEKEEDAQPMMALSLICRIFPPELEMNGFDQEYLNYMERGLVSGPLFTWLQFKKGLETVQASDAKGKKQCSFLACLLMRM